METNDDMVNYLVKKEKIASHRVEEAFRSVDRKKFVPEEYSGKAYEDRPLRLTENSTISAPHMVAINTELLEPEDNRVVEIGSGSGYQLAILSELAEEVKGVELNEELVEKSRRKLEDRENVEVFQGSGLGPVEGKFDRILFSCAVDSIEPFLERLKEIGILVAPVNEESNQRLKKWENGETTKHGMVRFTEFR